MNIFKRVNFRATKQPGEKLNKLEPYYYWKQDYKIVEPGSKEYDRVLKYHRKHGKLPKKNSWFKKRL